MTLTVIYQHTMNTKTSPETRINQTDDFHALLECIHRFVLQVMDQTAELALRIQGVSCLISIRCFYYLPFPWYVHAILPCWYHEYHASWREDRAQSLASCVHATITDHEYQALIMDNAYTYLSILFTTIQEVSKLSNVESSLGTFFIHTGNRTTWTPWASPFTSSCVDIWNLLDSHGTLLIGSEMLFDSLKSILCRHCSKVCVCVRRVESKRKDTEPKGIGLIYISSNCQIGTNKLTSWSFTWGKKWLS